MRRIGVLLNATVDDPEYQARLGAFLQGLQPLGWSIGRNVRIDPQGGSRQGAGKKTELAARVAAEGRFPMKTVADVLDVARSHLHERVHRPAPPRGHYCKADEELLPLIRRVVDQRPTYGYRRVTALVNITSISQDGVIYQCVAYCDREAKQNGSPMNAWASALWHAALKREGYERGLRREDGSVADWLNGSVVVVCTGEPLEPK